MRPVVKQKHDTVQLTDDSWPFWGPGYYIWGLRNTILHNGPNQGVPGRLAHACGIQASNTTNGNLSKNRSFSPELRSDLRRWLQPSQHRALRHPGKISRGLPILWTHGPMESYGCGLGKFVTWGSQKIPLQNSIKKWLILEETSKVWQIEIRFLDQVWVPHKWHPSFGIMIQHLQRWNLVFTKLREPNFLWNRPSWVSFRSSHQEDCSQ